VCSQCGGFSRPPHHRGFTWNRITPGFPKTVMVCTNCHIEPASAGLATFEASEAALPARILELVASSGYPAPIGRTGSTQRAYETDTRMFLAHFARYQVDPFPPRPDSVAAYLATDAISSSPATVRRRAASIRNYYESRGHRSPTDSRVVREVLARLAARGQRSSRKMSMTDGSFKAMLEAADQGLKGLRDRALLHATRYANLLRSEVVALDVGDLRFEARGAVIRLRGPIVRRSQEILIPRKRRPEGCSVAAIEAWAGARGLGEGPLFWTFRQGAPTGNRMDGRDVTRLIQALARRADVPGNFGANSLRVRSTR
jgi:integrase